MGHQFDLRQALYFPMGGLIVFINGNEHFSIRKAIAVAIQNVAVGNDEPLPGSADLGLHSSIQASVRPDGNAAVPIGIAAKPPSRTYIRIAPRSGSSPKMISIGVGVVDNDCIGEMCVVMCNPGAERFQVCRTWRLLR